MNTTCLLASIAGLSVAFGAAAEDRSFDGTLNNAAHPEWGCKDTPLLRACTIEYADGVSAPAGAARLSPRMVSNIVGAQAVNLLSALNLSDLHTAWGQFVDHDIDLTTDPGPETLPIPVPTGDPWFDPYFEGGHAINFKRSIFDPASGTGPGNPREQINTITAYMDASLVYGSDPVRAAALRRNDGSGKLLTSAGDRLPYNTFGLPNANPRGAPMDSLFFSGDIRTNENCQLIALHTLFVREHNRLCDAIAAGHPDWTDEQIYQRARKWVGATIQAITYEEYLPLLLGKGAMPGYSGYDAAVNAGIRNEFQTLAFRYGHSQVNEILLRIDQAGDVIPEGNVNLRDTFFAPEVFVEAPLEAWLHGAARMVSQEIDIKLVSSLRNFLFGPPGSAFGLDLFCLNTQRGRDHGLPDLNQLRADYGLPPYGSFSEITGDPVVAAALAEAYDDVNEVDPWIGALAEDHMPGAAIGETFHAIIVNQFVRLRAGDRFWYENDPAFDAEEVDAIRATRLRDVVLRNTDLTSFPKQPMVAANGYQPLLADLDLDGRVNGSDLFVLILNWGPVAVATDEPRADLDGDGAIGFLDLLLLLSSWQG